MSSLSRRRFLARALAFGGLALLAPHGLSRLWSGGRRDDRSASSPGRERAGDLLGEAVSDPESARAVGAAHLDGGADRLRVEALGREISCRMAEGESPDALRAMLQKRVRRDFREGRLADVDGWKLSRTEADYCALVFLASAR